MERRFVGPALTLPVGSLLFMGLRKIIIAGVALCLLFAVAGCRRPKAAHDINTITIYGFSVMKDSLEKEIFPAFQKEWLEHTGQEVKFASSFAGSETVTNQVISGVPADVAIVAIERNAVRLKTFGATQTDWHVLPYEGVINRSPFVIVVRKGNPKGIHDFPDMAKPGVRVLHPDPTSSGGAQWSLMSIYGSEIIKAEKATGKRDTQKAFDLLHGIWKNVIATPESARQARTQFESGFGDVLVTYEQEALQLLDRQFPIEIIAPRATIFSEHTVVIVDRRMNPDKRPLVEAFVKYLWSDAAQKAFVKYHFRSITDEMFDDNEPNFVKIEMPFTISDFGGWEKAYPEVIERVWKYQIQAMK